ncbi:MAG TPA: cupin domain-containing protein [Dehalococcoidia bacterium]|nr:cupin domain-containing protein [Dehalococcoidia bacterium]
MAEHVPEYIREHGPLQTDLRQVRLADELRTLHQEPAWQRGERAARTLVKQGDLRVVLTAMRSGTSLKEHSAEGALTIYCVDGRMQVSAAGCTLDLQPGDLIALDGGVQHSVDATLDCAFLLTIAQ